ncbi:triosephosphate isomerase [Candidatus Dependentiae bacterium Noda2021]|nr:triosephosphate isomerase [Candidatus Dependentiae bacterium Noda2021]
MKNFIIVSNWKMQLSYQQALSYLTSLVNKMSPETATPTLVFCPSFDALAGAQAILKNTIFNLGAQDCSAHSSGAFTGQVQARSLAELSCRYTIIGHNELRVCGQTSELIAAKMSQLRAHNIIPIVCVGESADDKQNNNSQAALKKQIQPLVDELNKHSKNKKQIIIAYEPVWAIGTLITPSTEYITAQLVYIKNLFNEMTHPIQIQTLYGGSIDENTITSLLKIPELDGILLGKASLDSQKFKKIVRSCMSITKN